MAEEARCCPHDVGRAGIIRDITVAAGPGDGLAVLMTAGAALLENCTVTGARIEATGDAAPEIRDCRLRQSAGAGLPLAGDCRAVVRGGLEDPTAAALSALLPDDLPGDREFVP